MRHRSQSEAGFSLLELMVAMLMTLIVSGAIYGLLAAGQTAFRREPEVAELTQSVRAAMSLIQQDVESAGYGFSTFTQVFTDGLDDQQAPGVNEAQFSVVAGNDDKYSDQLELLGADEQCPGITVCQAPAGGSGYIVDVSVDVPACMRVPGRLMGLIGAVGTAAPAFIIGQPVVVGAVGPACVAVAPPAGAPQGVAIDLPNTNGPIEWHPAAAPVPPAPPTSIGPVRVVRYRVALSGDPQDPVPCLWRSETGGRLGPAYAAMTDPPGAAWQMVARGVEDLQVQYMNGNGAYADTPGVIVAPVPVVQPLTQIIRRVRVTLSARSTAQGITGIMAPEANADKGIPVAVRVQITSEMSPRAALLWLQQIGDWK